MYITAFNKSLQISHKYGEATQNGTCGPEDGGKGSARTDGKIQEYSHSPPGMPL